METTGRYLEDFAVGQTFRSGRLQIDRERIKAFGAEFDPQPFHLDEEAARDSIFGGLAASGWHTAAVTMRLMVESDIKPAGGIVGAGFDEFFNDLPAATSGIFSQFGELHFGILIVEGADASVKGDLSNGASGFLSESGATLLCSHGCLLCRRLWLALCRCLRTGAARLFR